MISLTPDDNREVGNEIWIEDLWNDTVQKLFPKDIQSVILNLSNEWQELRDDLIKKEKAENIPFGPYESSKYLSLCLADDATSYLLERKKSEGPETGVWTGLSEKATTSWPLILKGLSTLTLLLKKDILPEIIIELPPFNITHSAIMTKGIPVPLGVVMASLCFYYKAEGFTKENALTFVLSTQKNSLQYTWWTGVFLSLEKKFQTPSKKNHQYYFSKGEGSNSRISQKA
ncbi:hypothetical protein OAK75_09960 [Bacteriovoracales bacterium]|nr:hypothetical protein [Bacteriovoracales bacterium]